MKMSDVNPTNIDLATGFKVGKANWNLDSEELVEQTLALGQGVLNNTGALCVSTGKYTGRSPKDRYIVKDEITQNTVDWGAINIPVTPSVFDKLYQKMVAYVADKEVWIRDVIACASDQYQITIRVVNETPWANLFCKNMFLPTHGEHTGRTNAWLILQLPSFLADPSVDGIRQSNFTILNFEKKIILIGGSAYTGEMKKGVFSALNFLFPHNHGILPMHCAANEGEDGDVALFFGLSGTGKTTLSADPKRKLLGDDEHGWSEDAVFNFEGGCYAKCIGLTEAREPQIYNAIKTGALLENILFHPNSNIVNYEDDSVTENTRASYPISYIDGAKSISTGATPKNIFFLACDSFGVLPPISKLTKDQALFHFLSGYTSKVAGTEMGVTEPQATFSAGFGNVFLPLHPVEYAALLGKKLDADPSISIWLINTGWIGGPYGIGHRMNLGYTRDIISAAMNGALNKSSFYKHSIFGLMIPDACPDVPSEILDPREIWSDKKAYDRQVVKLANLFLQNFKPFEERATADILSVLPKVA